jgi:hypothetical protein
MREPVRFAATSPRDGLSISTASQPAVYRQAAESPLTSVQGAADIAIL